MRSLKTNMILLLILLLSFNIEAKSKQDIIPYSVSNPKSKHVIIEVFGAYESSLKGLVDKKLNEYVLGLSGDVSVLALTESFESTVKIVEYHSNKRTKFAVLEDLGNVTITDKFVLEQFLSRALMTYKESDFIALGFYGHGSGVLNEKSLENSSDSVIFHPIIGEDFENNHLDRNSSLKLVIDNNVLDNLKSGIGLTNDSARKIILRAKKKSGFKRKLDIIFFDTCLNGAIEVVVQFYDLCNVIVASASLIPRRGWNYKEWGELMAYKTPENPKEWAIQAVIAFKNTHKIINKKITIAAFDTSRVDRLLTALSEFKNTIESFGKINPSIYSELNNAFVNEAIEYEDEVYDIKSMLEKLINRNIDLEINAACNYLHSAIINTILSFDENSSGLSIYFPKNQLGYLEIEKSYKTLRFQKETNWLDFIKKIKNNN